MFNFKALAECLAGRKVPLRVSYFCTFRCNLRCSYCGLWKTKRDEMTTSQAKEMIDDFSDAGTMFWMFTGGEPLMRSDIGELVTCAREAGMATGLVTNGTLLGDRLNELRDLSYIVVSLDGPEKTNDRLRGEGSYRKALDSIIEASEQGFDVTINSVINRENVKNNFSGLRHLLSLSKELGTKVNFSVMYQDFANKDISLLSKEELASALEFIRSQGMAKAVMSRACIDSLMKAENWERCSAARHFCDVMPDGVVVPCLFRHEEGVDGTEHGFVNAFEALDPQHDCFCYSTCYNELNSTLNLDPRALWGNFIKYSGFLVR